MRLYHFCIQLFFECRPHRQKRAELVHGWQCCARECILHGVFGLLASVFVALLVLIMVLLLLCCIGVLLVAPFVGLIIVCRAVLLVARVLCAFRVDCMVGVWVVWRGEI